MVDQHDEDTYMELLKAAMVLKNQGSKHFREGEAEILIRDVIRESIGYYPISIPYDRLKEVAPLLNPFKNSLEPFADLLIDPE